MLYDILFPNIWSRCNSSSSVSRICVGEVCEEKNKFEGEEQLEEWKIEVEIESLEWQKILGELLLKNGYQPEWTCGSVADVLVPLHGLETLKIVIVNCCSDQILPSSWKQDIDKSKTGFLWSAYVILGDKPSQISLDHFSQLQISIGLSTSPMIFPVHNYEEMFVHLKDCIKNYQPYQPYQITPITFPASVAAKRCLKALATLSSASEQKYALNEARELLSHYGTIENIMKDVLFQAQSSSPKINFPENTIFRYLLCQVQSKPCLHCIF